MATDAGFQRSNINNLSLEVALAETERITVDSQTDISISPHCLICLESLEDSDTRLRALLPNCKHSLYCLECIIRWTSTSSVITTANRGSNGGNSRPASAEINQRTCPLCKTPIGKFILYDVRSDQDYRKYWLRPPRTTDDSVDESTSLVNSDRQSDLVEWGTSLDILQRRRRIQELNWQRSLEFRRQVYSRGLWALHLGSNSKSKQRPIPTPSEISTCLMQQRRALNFIRREFWSWPLDGLDTEWLTNYTMAIIKEIPLRQDSTINLLSEFLGPNGAQHFVHELYCFLRSPFGFKDRDGEMTKELQRYDESVRYRWQNSDRQVDGAPESSTSSRSQSRHVKEQPTLQKKARGRETERNSPKDNGESKGKSKSKEKEEEEEEEEEGRDPRARKKARKRESDSHDGKSLGGQQLEKDSLQGRPASSSDRTRSTSATNHRRTSSTSKDRPRFLSPSRNSITSPTENPHETQDSGDRDQLHFVSQSFASPKGSISTGREQVITLRQKLLQRLEEERSLLRATQSQNQGQEQHQHRNQSQTQTEFGGGSGSEEQDGQVIRERKGKARAFETEAGVGGAHTGLNSDDSIRNFLESQDAAPKRQPDQDGSLYQIGDRDIGTSKSVPGSGAWESDFSASTNLSRPSSREKLLSKLLSEKRRLKEDQK